MDINKRLEKQIQDINSKYPDAKKLTKKLLEPPKNWPVWCFLPMSAFNSILSQISSDFLGSINDMPILSALETWRYSKGIYKFHPETLDALISSDVPGTLPSQVLERLPEWCVYIDISSTEFTFFDEKIIGFYAHLEFDFRENSSELRFLLDTEKNKYIPLFIEFGSKITLEESFKKYSSDIVIRHAMYKSHDFDITNLKSDFKGNLENNSINKNDVLSKMKSLVSIVLYLCSEERDISNRDYPGQKPSIPKPKKIKKGLVFFPAEKIRNWNIGEKIGEKLLESKNESLGLGSKRPHLRRAHWHGFWKGSKENKTFTQKWLPPIFVGEQSEKGKENEIK